LSLARVLRDQSPQTKIVYIGLKGDKLNISKNEQEVFDEVYYISSGKFRRYHGESLWAHVIDIKTLALNFRDFFKVIIGIFQARKILKLVRPDAIFSKGGFVVVPVGITAHWRKIPIITHDSDIIPGLANRILGRWTTIHATGMPVKFYSYPPAKTRYVGIPVNPNIKMVTPKLQKEYKQQLGIPEDSLVLLIAGGGLGSKRVNELVLSIAPDLLTSEHRLYIVHITGQKHQMIVRQKYEARLSVGQMERVRILSYTNDFYKYSGAAELIITRSGATILAEFALQAKACIVIPSPFLAAGHQLKNAHELTSLNAAVVVSENVAPANLFKITHDLLENDQRRNELASKLSATAKPKASEKLVKILLAVASREEVPD
jgi:UDP-N-acetylglucosamine--N-acetylmuramyl-(pentapeptide) pyrophosphoryl-undecaprenol N-acetylglucosamine transferase